MVNHSWSTGDLELSKAALKISAKSPKPKRVERGQDFFRQAAALASHKWDEDSLPNGGEDPLASHLLDESFQERLELFSRLALDEKVAERSSLEIDRAMKAELSALVPNAETAQSFHQKLGAASKHCHWPVMVLLENAANWYLADRVRLFSSLRLKKKSLQIKIGADPRVRYYHAAIRNSKTPTKIIDILYWIQFDDEQSPIDGGFIRDHQVPRFVLLPKDVLSYFDLDQKLSAPLNCILNKALKQMIKKKGRLRKAVANPAPDEISMPARS